MMPTTPAILPPPRLDLGEMKSQLAKRLGPERARRYFSFLHRLLSQKLSKAEFDKLCLLTLGRENLPLHNQLIKSVIWNACQAKIPPPLKKLSNREDGLNLCKPPGCSNGDLLQSPRSSKLQLDERLEEVHVQENGHIGSYDLKRRLEGPDAEQAEHPVKKLRVVSNGIEEIVVGEDDAVLAQNNAWAITQHCVSAPIGIPFCSASKGGAKRSFPTSRSLTSSSLSCLFDCSELCRTEELKKRMERVVEARGLQGVTMDCANLLNEGLDAYLKRLIKSSLDVVEARSGLETMKKIFQKEKVLGKPINGIWLENSTYMHRCGSLDSLDQKSCLVSLWDFMVAMELNPRQLGEDAPLLLEKIRIRSFDQ
ncbi:hypothetical protein AXF42_Ash018549 [Apostasia shenzhenica]|uniref:Transcriptional coactivator Hfi1/Transcriptional adapter 1 n=1 Tax=Apostasia shenzhenica TaxID=1088818 RepID=A0A2I0APW3_9ASPA|nr:hypothetical protein AXF42_Ash018549 [Apostasia shenzhenica]